MSLQAAFDYGSTRVIALSRAALASFFALATSFELHQTGVFQDATFVLLIAYTFIAFLVLAVTWNSWWWEVRLSPYAHVLDLVVFTSLVFLTEGYISPFFTFFVFLVLSAAIRWGWIEALITTAIVVLLYLGASLSVTYEIGGPGLQLQRFVVRGANLAVLSFMIIWFGMHQSRIRRRADAEVSLTGEGSDAVIMAIMRLAAAGFRASRAVCFWYEREEPWLNVSTLTDGQLEHVQLAPDSFDPLVESQLDGTAFLFDMPRQRTLSRRGKGGQLLEHGQSIAPAFAAQFALREGIAIPLNSGAYDGWLFVTGVVGLASDDLDTAAEVEQHVAAELARRALFEADREAASNRSRLVLARDLHDSIVQFLTGMSMKLRSLRRSSPADAPLAAELEELEKQLAHEMRELRSLLTALRAPASGSPEQSADEQFRLLAWRLEKQWGATCRVRTTPEPLTLRANTHQQIEFLIREGVANAVKHGSARTIDVDIRIEEDAISLKVEDDGAGFGEPVSLDGEMLRAWPGAPRSISERVHAAGGSMHLFSDPGRGARLELKLPTDGAHR